jgi:hypothetical protein
MSGSTLDVIPINNTIQNWIKSHAESISKIGSLLGIPPSAIAAPLVQEAGTIIVDAGSSYHERVTDYDIDWYIDHVPSGVGIAQDFADRRKEIEASNGLTWAGKLFHPTGNDLGWGNVNLGAAILTLQNYLKDPAEKNDPLGLAKYKKDYSALAHDLIDPQGEASFAISGLIAQQGNSFFHETYGSAFDKAPEQVKTALLTTWFKQGAGKVRRKTAPGSSLPDPMAGDGGPDIMDPGNWSIIQQLLTPGGAKKASMLDLPTESILGEAGLGALPFPPSAAAPSPIAPVAAGGAIADAGLFGRMPGGSVLGPADDLTSGIADSFPGASTGGDVTPRLLPPASTRRSFRPMPETESIAAQDGARPAAPFGTLLPRFPDLLPMAAEPAGGPAGSQAPAIDQLGMTGGRLRNFMPPAMTPPRGPSVAPDAPIPGDRAAPSRESGVGSPSPLSLSPVSLSPAGIPATPAGATFRSGGSGPASPLGDMLPSTSPGLGSSGAGGFGAVPPAPKPQGAQPAAKASASAGSGSGQMLQSMMQKFAVAPAPQSVGLADRALGSTIKAVSERLPGGPNTGASSFDTSQFYAPAGTPTGGN